MKTIVVGVDGSSGSKAALVWTVDQVRRQRDARIVALRAWQPVVPESSLWWAEYDIPYDLHAGTMATLEAIVAEVRATCDHIEIDECVVRGSSVGALLDAARAADALVVGSRGFGGFEGLLLGSVSQQLVTQAQCPTIVVPQPGSRASESAGEPDPHRIVVGVNGSPSSLAALAWAGAWARNTDAHVRAVHAGRCPSSDITDLPTDVPFELLTREDEPRRVLLEEGARAGLVVVGTGGHGGFGGVPLGSIATAVVHHCPCPVAIVPPPHR